MYLKILNPFTGTVSENDPK